MALYKNEPESHALTGAVRVSPGLRLTPSERKVLVWLGDMLVTVLASVGALWLWTFTRPYPFTLNYLADNAHWIPILTISWTLAARAVNLYDSRLMLQRFSMVQRLFGVAIAMLVGYLLIFFAIAPRDMLPRLPLLYFLLLALGGCGLWRWAYAAFRVRGALRRKVIVIGAGGAGHTLARLLQDQYAADFQIVGFVDDDPAKRRSRVADLPVLGSVGDVLHLAPAYGVDAVVYAITNRVGLPMLQTLLDCLAAGLSVIQMPTLYETLTGRVPVEHVRTDWLLPNEITGGQPPLSHRLFTIWLDWGFALAGGIVLLLIGPLVALLIKLDSPGPIFYRQTRLGLGGVPFELLKFRSMIADAEKEGGAQWATQDDPRVTHVGRFLRAMRLDELPQVLNIMRGDIHLIGPRPERFEFIAQLEQELPFYRARLAVKPGLTGWAQVKYRYGSTARDAMVKLEYDLYYIKNRSVGLDLSILLKTIGTVVMFKGR